MTQLTILSFFPGLSNINGDLANANVLARRAQWAGYGAQIQQIFAGDDVPATAPDMVIIGTCPDSKMLAFRDALMPFGSALAEWVHEGVGLLAVGAGVDVLCEKFDIDNKRSVDGLGVFPAVATWQDRRVSDDLVVRSGSEVLVGYQNDRRALILNESVDCLGHVVYGEGNGNGTGIEGVIVRNACGTHLHGPVFAKNPSLADRVLTTLLERRGVVNPALKSERAQRVDAFAKEANAIILKRLRVKDDEAP